MSSNDAATNPAALKVAIATDARVGLSSETSDHSASHYIVTPSTGHAVLVVRRDRDLVASFGIGEFAPEFVR